MTGTAQATSRRTALFKKNIIASFAIKGGSILVSFLLVPMTLGYLNEYEYGIWLTLNSVLSWIYIFDIGLGNGMRNKLTESLARNDMASAKIYVSTSFFGISLIALAILLLFFAGNYFVNWYDILNVDADKVQNLGPIVAIVMSMTCLTFILKLTGNIYMSYQLPAINNLLSFLGNAVSLIFIFILTKTASGSLMDVAIAYTSAVAIVYVIACPVTFMRFKEIAPSFKAIRLNYLKNLITLGVKFLLIQLAVLVIFMTSNVIISNMFGPAEVTPYNISFKLFSTFSMAFTIILTPLWSAVTDSYARGDYQWIHKSFKKMTLIWCLLVAGVIITILIAKPIYNMWVGDGVDIPFRLTMWMAIYTALSMLSSLYANIINGFGKLKVQLITAVFQGIIYIPVAIMCGHRFGTVGILIAMSGVCLLSAIINCIQCRMLIHNKAHDIWAE